MTTASQSTPALEQRQCRYSELLLSRFSGLEIEMNRGSKDEREDHGAQNAANNSDGERLKHLGAFPDREGQREHASDGGESGHAIGRRRRRPAWIMESWAEKPRGRKRCSE